MNVDDSQIIHRPKCEGSDLVKKACRQVAIYSMCRLRALGCISLQTIVAATDLNILPYLGVGQHIADKHQMRIRFPLACIHGHAEQPGRNHTFGTLNDSGALAHRPNAMGQRQRSMGIMDKAAITLSAI